MFAASASVFSHRPNTRLRAQENVAEYINQERHPHRHTLPGSGSPLEWPVFYLFAVLEVKLRALHEVTFFFFHGCYQILDKKQENRACSGDTAHRGSEGRAAVI